MAACVSRTLAVVTPVVAWADLAVAEKLYAASPDEVARVFHVPLRIFLKAEGHSHHDQDWNGLRFRVHEFQHLLPKHFGGDSMRIWGLTASILIRAAEIGLRRHPHFPLAPVEHTPKNEGPNPIIDMPPRPRLRKRQEAEPGRGGLSTGTRGLSVRRQVTEIHLRGAFQFNGLTDSKLPPGCCFWLFEVRSLSPQQ